MPGLITRKILASRTTHRGLAGDLSPSKSLGARSDGQVADAHVNRLIDKLDKWPCGTVQKFKHAGCRCEACRAANKEYDREHSKKGKAHA